MGWSRRRVLGLAAFTMTAGAAGLSSCTLWATRRQHRSGDAENEQHEGYPRPEQTARLFQDGSRHLLETGDWATASTKSGGVLHMPTGRLVAADPSWLPSRQRLGISPYTVAVPRGAY